MLHSMLSARTIRANIGGWGDAVLRAIALQSFPKLFAIQLNRDVSNSLHPVAFLRLDSENHWKCTLVETHAVRQFRLFRSQLEKYL